MLTEAFAEPRERYGIDMPLDALVSLVITFNEGIILERLSGIETGQAELLQWIDGLAERRDDHDDHRGARAPRASRAARATPTRRDTSSATGCASSTRSTARRADHPAAADVVDHPLAPLEGADPLPRPPRRVVTFDGRGNGRSDRPATAEAYAEREFAADALAVMDATGDRARRPGRACRRARCGASCSPPSTRSAWPARCSSRPRRRSPSTSPAVARRSTSRSTATRAGSKYNRHYWLEHYRDFLEFFFGQMLHGAALDQADRGLRRLGPRDRRARRSR